MDAIEVHIELILIKMARLGNEGHEKMIVVAKKLNKRVEVQLRA